jgi:hypothetical protein
LGQDRDRIQVWVSDPNAHIAFVWALDESASVTLTLSMTRVPSADVVVLLQCGSRFRDPASTTLGRATLQVIDGDEGACDPEVADESRAPLQTVTVRLDSKHPVATVSGEPASAWTDEAAGERVSHAPFVEVGGETTSTLFDEIALYPPVGADVTTWLQGSSAESLDSFFPPQIGYWKGATSEVNTGENATPGNFGPTVAWQGFWSRDEMAKTYDHDTIKDLYYRHTFATANWTDSAGIARSQQWLLLSGVLLGIVGSVVIEALFWWANRRRTA